MNARWMFQVALSALVAVCLVAALPGAMAQESEDERPWKDIAEFSFVNTSGNAENTNFALANKFIYNWAKSSFTFDAGALRAETTTRVLTNPSGTVVVNEISDTTAESYYAVGRYRREINDALYWYGGLGWDRNEFAGIDSRYVYSGGIGYKFFDNDGHSLAGEFGADYTDETQVSGSEFTFAGARAFLGYARPLSETANLTSDLELLQNLDETDDLRGRWVTALTAALSSQLALKVSYSMFYDNQPAVIVVPGPAPGLFVFDDTDSILSASLVVNF